MNAIETALQKLRKSKVRYVVFGAYQRARNSPTNARSVSILCESAPIVADIIGAKRVGSVKECHFSIVDENRAVFAIQIYEMGKGVFPASFETEMIANSVVVDNSFNGLDLDREFWAALYSELIHNGRFEQSLRLVLLSKLKERFGVPSRPKYGNLGFHPSPYRTPVETQQAEEAANEKESQNYGDPGDPASP